MSNNITMCCNNVTKSNFIFLILKIILMNGEIHNAYNLYNMTDVVTMVPRREFFLKNSAEEALKTAY